MKPFTLILSAAVSMSSPALATDVQSNQAGGDWSGKGKTWVDDDCTIVLDSGHPTGFQITSTQSGDPGAVCWIDSWPIDNPTATLKCDNGLVVQMTPKDDNTIIFDGMTMKAFTGDLPCTAPD